LATFGHKTKLVKDFKDRVGRRDVGEGRTGPALELFGTFRALLAFSDDIMLQFLGIDTG
jgi:hypothetical protein